jgi:hypothetical protein
MEFGNSTELHSFNLLKYGGEGMSYDFKAARDHQQYLIQLYRVGRKLCPDDTEWGWDLLAQIDEIEREIAEAHASANRKMTILADGHPVMHISNLIAPIVPQWAGEHKGEYGI